MIAFKQIAVIGSNADTCTDAQYQLSYDLGIALADQGYTIVCGGRGGIMEAVCKGAKTSLANPRGISVGILPGIDSKEANTYCDVVIPSGIGHARNALVANAGEVVIAIGGSAGTLSELAFAWHYQKPILAVLGLGGWSEQLAGKKLDDRQTNPIYPVHTVDEILSWLSQYFA